MLRTERPGPINAFACFRIDDCFEQASLDEHLLGPAVQAQDKLVHSGQLPIRRHYDQLAAAVVGQNPASLVCEGGLDGDNQVGRGGPGKLIDLGGERFQRCGILGGDARDSALGILHQLECIIVQQRAERLLGGDVLPVDGYGGLGCRFAIRAGLAKRDLGIQHVVEVSLPGQVLDRVRQRDVVHDDEGDYRAGLGGSHRAGARGGRVRCRHCLDGDLGLRRRRVGLSRDSKCAGSQRGEGE